MCCEAGLLSRKIKESAFAHMPRFKLLRYSMLYMTFSRKYFPAQIRTATACLMSGIEPTSAAFIR